ncbi:transmembrane protein 164 [Eurytemora carolleeae]|uniref:transmembrane protein 164 n=1 Tax=Eurytemora carolleeae TaxID=1294199 RepID=UPI000C762B2E|nr:transmembrane protein 164 [Eurytemora carolleeae]|eukprot:XP_023329587.1 transmembrane protein 164-like [Eurytemora affinis]
MVLDLLRAGYGYLGKILETVLLGGLALILYFWANQKILRLGAGQSGPSSLPVSGQRQIIVILYSLMLGIQLGFKFATKSLIYILQPCHVVTSLQVFLLAAPVNQYTARLYRIQLGVLNGALLALIFPVTDTYSLPFEIEMYWIQHSVMLLVPFYLYRQGDPFSNIYTDKFAYSVLAYSVFMIYHIFILQPISCVLGVNISTVLCPSPTDPFYGENYILHAGWNQAVVIFSLIGIYTVLLSLVPVKQQHQQHQQQQINNNNINNNPSVHKKES